MTKVYPSVYGRESESGMKTFNPVTNNTFPYPHFPRISHRNSTGHSSEGEDGKSMCDGETLRRRDVDGRETGLPVKGISRYTCDFLLSSGPVPPSSPLPLGLGEPFVFYSSVHRRKRRTSGHSHSLSLVCPTQVNFIGRKLGL